MSPLHFGHSIAASLVAICTAGGEAKQEPNQFLSIRNFNILGGTYLLPGLFRGVSASTKTFNVSYFCQEKCGGAKGDATRHCLLARDRTSS